MNEFNGLGMNTGNLWRLSKAKTRSISPENPTGEKGKGAMAEADPNSAARELGKGWKCKWKIDLNPGEIVTMADIEGPGAIQSIWFTGCVGRDLILRIYWDNQELPSVECPVSDFFSLPWTNKFNGNLTNGPYVHVNSETVAVCPNHGCNCYWEMPFHDNCHITLQNINPIEKLYCTYQINYILTDIPSDAAYFHAQFRRVNPLPYGEVYTILDGISGEGQYIGTSMGWGINSNNWWGEGEIKFYLDGDSEYPTICGTGTEDYFGGSTNWEVDQQYVTYTTPYLGMHQVIKPDGLYNAQHRHAMYRWHIKDPIRFDKDIKVTIQALGWRDRTRYYLGQHDICSVAYWYQTLPTPAFPKLPDRNELEIV